MVHNTEVGSLIHLDLLHIETGESLEGVDVGNEASMYLVILVENMSDYTWLEPAAARTVVVSAEILLR